MIVETAAGLFIFWVLDQYATERRRRKAADALELIEQRREFESWLRAHECWCRHTKDQHGTSVLELLNSGDRSPACNVPGCPCKEWHTEASEEERAYLSQRKRP